MIRNKGMYAYLSERPVLRTSLVLILILTCSVYLEACSGRYETKYSREDLKASGMRNGEYIMDVRKIDGQSVVFASRTGYYNDSTKHVVGRRIGTANIETIPIDSVSFLRVAGSNAGIGAIKTLGMILLVSGGLLVVAAIAVAASSCPFIYTHNGKEFVLDAEPLGGAIAEGLERTDLSPLHNIKPVNGKYLVMSRNEADETQYIDEMRLLYVDHPQDKQVVADPLGQLQMVSIPTPPIKATNAKGESILDLVSKRDNRLWSSKPTTDDAAPQRDELTFTFKRPADADEARLVVKMGTALWGGSMIRSMLEMRGDSIDKWYRSINSYGTEFRNLAMFNMREELFLLKVFVKEGDSWVQREVIPGSGPFVTEERTLPVDLSKISGDVVEIRIAPPEGFWQIDQFTMSFGESKEIEPKELTMTNFTSNDKSQSADMLESTDKKRYMMPKVGDEFTMEFDVPELAKNMKRTVFLKSHGYYELHLPKGNPENAAMLKELTLKPGAIIKHSRARLRDWLANPEKYEKLPTTLSQASEP